MVIVNVVYPNEPGSKFDEAYYQANHIRLIKEVWGNSLESVRVLHGQAGLGSDEPAFHAIVELGFPSMEAFGAAMGHPRSGELSADVVNYTDVTPKMQISRLADA